MSKQKKKFHRLVAVGCEPKLTAADRRKITELLADTTIFLQDVPSIDAELIAAIDSSDAVLVGLFVNMTAEVIRQSKSLRYIGVCGSNLRRIDLEAAQECDIVVNHVTGYCDADTAQWIVANMLQHHRLLGTSTSLVGKTLGIIGLGAIGTEVAKLGTALQMRVLYTARTTRNNEYIHCDSLDVMIQQADVLVIATPPHIQVMNGDNLEKIASDALVVNVSVGLSIEPQAFKKWILDTERRTTVVMDAAAGGYYKDIAATIAKSEPNAGMVPRLQISDQYAYSTPESKERLSNMILQHAEDFLHYSS